MPVARTIANSVSVLIENPNAYRPANDPMSEIGTAIKGMRVARQLYRKTNTTASTRSAAMKRVWITSLIEACTKRVVSKGIM